MMMQLYHTGIKSILILQRALETRQHMTGTDWYTQHNTTIGHKLAGLLKSTPFDYRKKNTRFFMTPLTPLSIFFLTSSLLLKD